MIRPHHRHTHRVAVGAAGLAASLLIAGACSNTSSPNTVDSSAASSTTTASGSHGSNTTGTSHSNTTGTSAGATGTTMAHSKGSTSSASLSTEGACGWLTVDEINEATGITVTKNGPLRKGCRWQNGMTPVVDIDVEKSASVDEAKAAFEADRALGEDNSVTLPQIGDGQFWDGLSTKVVFVKGDTVYTVWIQSTEKKAEKQAATVALAQQVVSQLA